MKYKLIKDYGIDAFNYETVVFGNRGFEDESEYANYILPERENLLDYNLLDNIDKGCELLMKHIKAQSNILVVVDCDTDGFTSAATLINFLTDTYGDSINLDFVVHQGKEHGLSSDITIPDNVSLVILPDASSNDYEQHKALSDLGIDILVLDHHEADEGYSKHATVVNNQLSQGYTNKSLTGAGVVYQFIRAFNNMFKLGVDVDNYLDLVAVGLIADMADVRDLETRFMIHHGLTNLKTPIMLAFMEAQSFSLKGNLDQTGVSFSIAPLINAMIRSGSQEEKEMLFKAFDKKYCGVNVQSTKQGSSFGDTELFEMQALRICKNLKSRVDKENEKHFKRIKELVEKTDLINNKILIFDVTDIGLEKTQVGLVANKLVAEYKRPVLLVTKTLLSVGEDQEIETYSGSGRSVTGIDDFRDLLLESELVLFAQGHGGAFGVSFERNKADDIVQYMNKKLSELSTDVVYDVDFILKGKKDENRFRKIAEKAQSYRDRKVWGRGFDEPYVVIENAEITGKPRVFKGSTLKFNCGPIDFLQFRAKEELITTLEENYDKITITVLGRAELSEYNGKVNAQMRIVDIIVNDKKATQLKELEMSDEDWVF